MLTGGGPPMQALQEHRAEAGERHQLRRVCGRSGAARAGGTHSGRLARSFTTSVTSKLCLKA